MKASKIGKSLPVLEIASSGKHERVVISAEHRRADDLLQSPNAAYDCSASLQFGISKLLSMYAMQTLASFAKSADAAPALCQHEPTGDCASP